MLTPHGRHLPLVTVIAAVFVGACGKQPDPAPTNPPAAPTVQQDLPLGAFAALLAPDEQTTMAAFAAVDSQWQNAYTPMILELTRMRNTSGRTPALVRLMEKNTGQSFGTDHNQWWH